MSNIDKVGEVILDLIWDLVYPELDRYQSAQTIARSLADAGLLMPDLPEPVKTMTRFL